MLNQYKKLGCGIGFLLGVSVAASGFAATQSQKVRLLTVTDHTAGKVAYASIRTVTNSSGDTTLASIQFPQALTDGSQTGALQAYPFVAVPFIAPATSSRYTLNLTLNNNTTCHMDLQDEMFGLTKADVGFPLGGSWNCFNTLGSSVALPAITNLNPS